MNTLQNLILGTPFSVAFVQIVILCVLIFGGFVAALMSSGCLRGWRAGLGIFCGCAAMVGGYWLGASVFGGLYAESGTVNEQMCRISDREIVLRGSEVTPLPSEIKIAGQSLPVNNWGENPAVRVLRFSVNGNGWAFLRMLGLRRGVDVELGVPQQLLVELEKFVSRDAAIGIAVALQSESPKINQTSRGFNFSGKTSKPLYGVNTDIFFDVDILPEDFQAMVANPIIAGEFSKTNLLAQK